MKVTSLSSVPLLALICTGCSILNKSGKMHTIAYSVPSGEQLPEMQLISCKKSDAFLSTILLEHIVLHDRCSPLFTQSSRLDYHRALSFRRSASASSPSAPPPADAGPATGCDGDKSPRPLWKVEHFTLQAASERI